MATQPDNHEWPHASMNNNTHLYLILKLCEIILIDNIDGTLYDLIVSTIFIIIPARSLG